jgi:hypothetical protein
MTQPKPPFILTHEDKQTPLWHKLMAHWEDKLATLRMQNDGDKAESETARLRGQIVAVKACLALNNAPPDLEAPPR